ncbi:MAG TPA: hypothetical protein VM433_13200, partial [Mycobacteriales bacterium]|nr:hypothetical protein [Mycobacteriales bacterium]
GCPAADPSAVGALLDELAHARLSLSSDLGLLAAAVELGAHDVAVDVVEGTRNDLAAFTARITSPSLTGTAAHSGDQPSSSSRADRPAAVPAADTARLAPLHPRRRALRAALPVAPALAAAALIGVLAGVLPAGPSTAPPTGTPDMTAAASSYAELFRLHERGATSETLVQAAHGLHAEVARVMALAATDPAAAEQALRLLAQEVASVGDDDQRAELRSVLALSRRLLAELTEQVGTGALPAPVDAALPERLPAPEPQPAPSAPNGATPAPAGEVPSSAPDAPGSPSTPLPAGPRPTPSGTGAPHPSEPPSPLLLPPGSTKGAGPVLPAGGPDLSG